MRIRTVPCEWGSLDFGLQFHQLPEQAPNLVHPVLRSHSGVVTLRRDRGLVAHAPARGLDARTVVDGSLPEGRPEFLQSHMDPGCRTEGPQGARKEGPVAGLGLACGSVDKSDK